MPVQYNHDHENEITLFAETNYRGQRRRFGIKTDDRRRHMYVIGKTGMGKTVLQENMVMSDIMAGHGVCYVDPHGDTAEKILDYIPSNRINDVVYFNPADMEFPVGFNILETVNDNQKHLIASGLMGVFKKIWPDVWSPRMEYILLNCVLALLDYPGATLLGINRLLVDAEFRARVVTKIRDPIVKTFWVAEFASWNEKYATEAIAPIQNKVGQFLSASIVRNIVSQVKSTVDLRKIMDEGKIFIVNLSKGRIGEENMRLLGGMLIARLQMAAMERVDMLEDERRDFYLFVDEFQNFATESFASILSEARKYRLCLTVAHQYIEQLTEEVRAAVIGNVGTLLTFRVGSTDAEFLEREFAPTFTADDLVNLTKYTVYLKLMVDGVASPPFSANTLPPIAKYTGNAQKVIAVSRERYAMPRATIAEKVLRWSGMETPSLRSEQPVEGQADNIKVADLPEVKLENEEEEGGSSEEYLRIMPERLAMMTKAAAQSSGKKKDKPAFPHTCSRCGKVWEMPIQLDASRPMYCAECLPIVREEQKMKGRIAKAGPGDSPRNARPAPQVKPETNKPRIVGRLELREDADEGQKLEARNSKLEEDKKATVNPKGLLEELERIKGKAIETSKTRVEKRLDRREEGGSWRKEEGRKEEGWKGGRVEEAKKPQYKPAEKPVKEHKKPKVDVADYFSKFEDLPEKKNRVEEDGEPPSTPDVKPPTIVFKKPAAANSSLPQHLRASTEYPSAGKPSSSPNPLDKRAAHGPRPEASGAVPQPPSAPPSPPSVPMVGKTLNPGQKVTF